MDRRGPINLHLRPVMDVDADSESCSCGTAEELLLKTIGESRYVLIEDVTKILASDVFVNDMMATCKGVTAYRATHGLPRPPVALFHLIQQKTLLHMAAMARDVSVLTTVVQAYKKAGLLVRALSTATQNEDGSTPLHIAVHSSSYENTVLLLKECQEHCPDILTATRNGIGHKLPLSCHSSYTSPSPPPLSLFFSLVCRCHTFASGCILVRRGYYRQVSPP